MQLIKMVKLFVFVVLCATYIHAATPDDSTRTEVISDSAFVMTKSPWLAMGLSAVAPGAGQIYNESYWKAPVVWALQGWLVYNFILNNKDYNNNADLYIQTKDFRYKKLRDFYHDQRDQFGTYILLTYMLTLVDAYVDAHLFDFTVQETPLGRRPTLKFTYSF